MYFECFVVASWTFAIGWFVGAIYVQEHNEKRENPRAEQELEPCMECEAWRLPVAASASAD